MTHPKTVIKHFVDTISTEFGFTDKQRETFSQMLTDFLKSLFGGVVSNLESVTRKMNASLKERKEFLSNVNRLNKEDR